MIKKIIEGAILLVLLLVFLLLGRGKLAVFYYNQGNNYYDRQAYQQAIDSFSKSLKINPTAAIVHYSLANSYMESGREEEAIAEYKAALQLDNKFSAGYRSLTEIYLKRQMYQEAMDLLQEAGNIMPDSPEIKSLIEFTTLEYVPHYVNGAVEAFLSADKQKAYALLNQALEINPNFSFARYTLGFFYYADKKYDQAQEALDTVIRQDNQFYLAHRLLGDIFFEKGVFERAIDEYKVSLQDSSEPDVLHNIGLAYMNLENYSAAIPFLERALKLDPENRNIRYSLASVYRDSGRLKEALAAYAQLIEKEPDYSNVHNDVADIYKQQGLNNEALEEYRREISFDQARLALNPNDPITLNDLAYAYSGIKEYDLAKEMVKKAISLKPDYRQAYLTLASIYKNLSQLDQALSALDQANKLSLKKYTFIEKDINKTRQLQDFLKDKIITPPPSTVYLTNGRQLRGIIRKETPKEIVLEIAVGNSIGTTTVLRDNIKRIERD